MKRCRLNRCNGDGIIHLENGQFLRCACLRYEKADELFNYSNAPKDYKVFIDELEFNPKLQNITKKQKLMEMINNGDITKNQYEQYMKKTISDLKDVLNQYDDGKNDRPIRRFIENRYKLIFYGDTGTGKSQAAVSLALTGASRNKPFYYLSMHTIHKLFRYNYNDPEIKSGVENAFKLIEKAQIIVIDDLGKENDGVDDVKLLKKIYSFIDSIIRAENKFVIVTSNVKYKEILDPSSEPKSDEEKDDIPKDLFEMYSKMDKRLLSMLTDGNLVVYKFRDKLRKKKTDSVLDDLI